MRVAFRLSRSPISPDILARHGSGRFVAHCRIHHAASRATYRACKKGVWALPRHLQQDLCVHGLLCFCSAVSASIPHQSWTDQLPCHPRKGRGPERAKGEQRYMHACSLAIPLFSLSGLVAICGNAQFKNMATVAIYHFYQFEDPETQTGHARTVTRTFKLQFAPGVVHPDMHLSY